MSGIDHITNPGELLMIGVDSLNYIDYGNWPGAGSKPMNEAFRLVTFSQLCIVGIKILINARYLPQKKEI
jgi:hypothetical protein